MHQFEKVEQFVVCEPERSWDEMSRMIKIASEFYDTLGLKYRIINVASNDINNACALKYDLEGIWSISLPSDAELITNIIKKMLQIVKKYLMELEV